MSPRHEKTLAAAGIILALIGLLVFLSRAFTYLELDAAALAVTKPIGGDFWFFWSAAQLGGQAYDPAAMHAVMQSLAAQLTFKPTPFFYPPFHLMLLAPFGALPYFAGYVSYFALGLLLFLAVVWLWVRKGWAPLFMLGFAGNWATLVNGQNSLYVAALFGLAVYFSERRPVLGGVLMGFLSLKPQLSLLWPIALLAGRFWKVLAVSILTILALIILPTAAFGPPVWMGYLQSTLFAGFLLNDAGFLYVRMPTVFASLRLLGASSNVALAVHAIFALVVIYVFIKLWWMKTDAGMRLALLSAASLLIFPYTYDYDLVLLAWPVLILLLRGVRGPFERFAVVLGYFWPLLTQELVSIIGLQLGFLGPLLLLAALGRRLTKEEGL